MKKFRQYVSVMLCVSMLFCITPAVSAANDADYICSPVRFTDGSGNTLTSMNAGTLKANITVKPNTDTQGSLIFALMLYHDHKLIASDSMTKTVSGGTEFSAQVTVPDNAPECQAVVVLWNSVNGMRAICAAAVFPGGSNLLRGLTADGNAITGFDAAVKDYTVTVENTAYAKPVINAEAANNASKVKYIGDKTFPGKTIVELTSANGSDTATYTVNYKTKTELSGNAHILRPAGGNYGAFDIGKNLNAGDGGDVKDSSRTAENGKLGSKVHWDRNQPSNYATGYTNEVRSIADDYAFLVGSDYIMCTAETGYRANSDYQTCFTLYRGATVYVFSSGATETEGWDLKTDKNNPFMVVQDNETRRLTNVSSKHYDVTNTTAGEEINIPAEVMCSIDKDGKKDLSVYLTVIKYDDYTSIGENEEETSPTPTETPTPTPTETPTPTPKPYGAGELKYTKNGQNYPVTDMTTNESPVVSNNFHVKTDDSYGSKLFANRKQPANDAGYTNEVVSIADEYRFLIGADYVMSCLAGWGERADSGFETEFRLYKDATVYLFAVGANTAEAEKNGWTVRETDDSSNTFMTVQRDQKDNMTYVLSKKFSAVDAVNGTRVVLTKEMLIKNGSGCLNFAIIDYKNNPVPCSVESTE